MNRSHINYVQPAMHYMTFLIIIYNNYYFKNYCESLVKNQNNKSIVPYESGLKCQKCHFNISPQGNGKMLKLN